ncbi:MAG: hypothetical protein JOZ87_16520 [Chloroflexi bacterium]|nr:hypothetical protein [Chloroflexota bacterium]
MKEHELADHIVEAADAGKFIVAQDGTIRRAFVDADWTHRHEPAELFIALESVATNCLEGVNDHEIENRRYYSSYIAGIGHW